MATSARRVPIRKRSQAGSLGGIVVLAALAFMGWWQWDWIAGLFGAAGGSVAEVVDYRCDRQPDGRMAFDGRVRNTSDSPIELRAVTAIYDSSGKKSDYREATVRPVPIPAGKVGDFRGDAGVLPDGGACKLDGFLDSAGKRVAHSGHHR
jgi:hypothetical protein